jgi:hypothetical protein
MMANETADKTLIIVVDQFSDRVFEYDNTFLYDYGYFETVAYIDNLFDVSDGSYSGYGNYDDILVTSADQNGSFYLRTPDEDGLDYADVDLDFKGSGSFTDYLGNTAFYDEFYRFSRIEETASQIPNHGDWVVEAICQNLDNLDATAILCVDVDTLNGSSSHFDKLFDYTAYNFQGKINYGSGIEKILASFLEIYDTRFSTFATETYHAAGLSVSIAGSLPSLDELYVLELFKELGLPIFQAAPNVGQGYFDWGSVYQDVINVGAWNKGSDGNLLLSSISTIGTLDIVADGRVEKSSWGSNFGTSFATPKVIADYADLLNIYISEIKSQGIDTSSVETDYSPADYSNLVTSVVNLLSKQAFITLSDDTSVIVPILSSTIETNGYYPSLVSGVTGIPNTLVRTAVAYTPNSEPSGRPSISGSVTEGSLLTASTSNIRDEDGLGSFSYTWLRDGNTVWGASSSSYRLTQDDVGSRISVKVSYRDGEGTSENVTSLETLSVRNVNDTPSGRPSISGSVTEGSLLRASTSTISDEDGLGSFS